MPITKYLYLTTIPDMHAELINAECMALTGRTPTHQGIAISTQRVNVNRSAYVRSCSELLFEAGSVAEICSKIRCADLYADEFRVSVVKLPRNLDINSLQLAHKIGGVIGGRPLLDAPRTVFLTVVTEQRIWFGRLLSESDNRWVSHSKRPHVTSSSLPTRLARAVVNLIASPGDRILDPCCGTGTIVLEAAQMGLAATGYDISMRMVGATQKNLRHFDLHADVKLGEAQKIIGAFDAVATDLPYGIGLVENAMGDRNILCRIRQLAPRAAFIHTRDLTKDLTDIGFRIDKIVPARKHTIVRQIFITSTSP